MNIARCCLLLMLMVLLPLRGVVAAAMPCSPEPMAHGPAQDARVAEVARVADMAMAMHLNHHPAHHPSAHDLSVNHRLGPGEQTDALAVGGAAHGHEAAHGAHAGKCQLCAASSASSTLPTQAASLPEPLAAPGPRFPTLDAPVPTFLADGLERPPRSL